MLNSFCPNAFCSNWRKKQLDGNGVSPNLQCNLIPGTSEFTIYSSHRASDTECIRNLNVKWFLYQLKDLWTMIHGAIPQVTLMWNCGPSHRTSDTIRYTIWKYNKSEPLSERRTVFWTQIKLSATIMCHFPIVLNHLMCNGSWTSGRLYYTVFGFVSRIHMTGVCHPVSSSAVCSVQIAGMPKSKSTITYSIHIQTFVVEWENSWVGLSQRKFNISPCACVPVWLVSVSVVGM